MLAALHPASPTLTSLGTPPPTHAQFLHAYSATRLPHQASEITNVNGQFYAVFDNSWSIGMLCEGFHFRSKENLLIGDEHRPDAPPDEAFASRGSAVPRAALRAASANAQDGGYCVGWGVVSRGRGGGTMMCLPMRSGLSGGIPPPAAGGPSAGLCLPHLTPAWGWFC